MQSAFPGQFWAFVTYRVDDGITSLGFAGEDEDNYLYPKMRVNYPGPIRVIIGIYIYTYIYIYPKTPRMIFEFSLDVPRWGVSMCFCHELGMLKRIGESKS